MLLLTADTLPVARLVCGTQEGVLNFAPTYRMVKGKPEYSNKKNQNASWCDRVLVRSFPGYRSRVEQTLYTGLFDLTQVSWGGARLTKGGRRFTQDDLCGQRLCLACTPQLQSDHRPVLAGYKVKTLLPYFNIDAQYKTNWGQVHINVS